MRKDWLLWVRVGLAVLPPALLLLTRKRNKRKANESSSVEGEPESNEQEIRGVSGDVGSSDHELREPALEPNLVQGDLESEQLGFSARCVDVSSSDQLREPASELQWEPKHRIFLSHSGAQKDFTEHLCDGLERVEHFPFFDRRDDSLRKGVRFFSLLKEAAKECHVAVLVLSDEYFTKSKWPMMELNWFVKAQESTNPGLRILPLFLEITREQFNEKGRRDLWLRAWEKMKEVDATIELAEWQHALSKIQGNNGMQYAGVTQGKSAFIKEVVAAVCKLLPPDVKYDVSHVQSMERLCQPILDKLKMVKPCDKFKACVVGLHGMGGVGKTTISRAVCNQMVGDFGGKACHVELGGENLVELRKKVLRELTEAGPEILVNEKDKLGHLLKMPILEHEGAIDLFLHYSRRSKESMNDCELSIVKRCVRECYFQKWEKAKPGDKENRTYHPLALKVLGSQLRSMRLEVWRWEETLEKLKVDKFNMLKDKIHPVFSILRLGYDALRIEEQRIFLDLALVWVSKWRSRYNEVRFEWEWLCIVHRMTEADMKESVNALQRKGLLDRVNNVEELDYSIHDLYIDFAEAEARAGPFEGRRFLINKKGTDVPHELQKWTPDGFWPSLERLIIHESEVQSLKRADLYQCKHVEVLDVYACEKVTEEIDVTEMGNLKCLVVTGYHSRCQLLGLEKLSSLVVLRWEVTGGMHMIAPECKIGDGLSSLTALQVLRLGGLEWSALDMFPPDMSTCTKLREFTISSTKRLSDRLDFSALVDFGKCLPKSVVKIDLSLCPKSVGRSPISSMSALTNLQDLCLNDCWEVEDLAGLCELISLQYLDVSSTGISRLPDDLGKLKQLRVLDVTWCDELTSIIGIAHVTALEYLNASQCLKLEELPDDFSNLKMLRRLDLCEDVSIFKWPKDYDQWIAKLPESEGILKVDVSGCYGLIVPFAKKLRVPELSRVKCDNGYSCGCESMELWIGARKSVDSAAYNRLETIILQDDKLWIPMVGDEEVIDVVIRALCEHDDRGNSLADVLVELVGNVLVRMDRAYFLWWVVVATAPCTFRVVTGRAKLKPWRKTLLHYTITRILPSFLEGRRQMMERREQSGTGDDDSDWETKTFLYRGVMAVLQKCKEKLEEACDQGIDLVRSNEGKKVVDVLLRELDAAKGLEIKDDNVLWQSNRDCFVYQDRFPNFPFELCLGISDLSDEPDIIYYDDLELEEMMNMKVTKSLL